MPNGIFMANRPQHQDQHILRLRIPCHDGGITENPIPEREIVCPYPKCAKQTQFPKGQIGNNHFIDRILRTFLPQDRFGETKPILAADANAWRSRTPRWAQLDLCRSPAICARMASDWPEMLFWPWQQENHGQMGPKPDKNRGWNRMRRENRL